MLTVLIYAGFHLDPLVVLNSTHKTWLDLKERKRVLKRGKKTKGNRIKENKKIVPQNLIL